MDRCLVGSQAEEVLCDVRWKNQLPCWCIRFTRWSRLISRFYIQNILNIWLFIAAVLTSIIIRQSRCPLSSLLCPSPQSVIISIIFPTRTTSRRHHHHHHHQNIHSTKIIHFLKSRIFNKKNIIFLKEAISSRATPLSSLFTINKITVIHYTGWFFELSSSSPPSSLEEKPA